MPELGTLMRRGAVMLVLMAPTLATAQANDPFGLQQRADAVSQMIVLGVQQGISSLPPTSGQAFTYDYNAELGTFVESEQLGPTVLRSTQTIGASARHLRISRLTSARPCAEDISCCLRWPERHRRLLLRTSCPQS